MLIARDQETGTVRLDADGLRALIASSRGAAVPEAGAVLEADHRLGDALTAVTDPVVTLDLAVAGRSSHLAHRAWVDSERAVVLAELRAGCSQLMVVPPDHLAAALARLARLRPRRTGRRVARPFPPDRLDDLVAPDSLIRSEALAQAGAGFAWQLLVGRADESRHLTAVDGAGGPFLADPEQGVLTPTTNTLLYRLFTTVLPAALPVTD